MLMLQSSDTACVAELASLMSCGRHPLEELQALLTHFLGRRPPAEVDSACIAGLLDLLRTRGLWHASVRYGYLFGGLAGVEGKPGLLHQLASHAEIGQIAALFEAEWALLIRADPEAGAIAHAAAATGMGEDPTAAASAAAAVIAASVADSANAAAGAAGTTEPALAHVLAKLMEERMVGLLCGREPLLRVRLAPGADAAALRGFIRESVRAFFEQDLL